MDGQARSKESMSEMDCLEWAINNKLALRLDKGQRQKIMAAVMERCSDGRESAANDFAAKMENMLEDFAGFLAEQGIKPGFERISKAVPDTDTVIARMKEAMENGAALICGSKMDEDSHWFIITRIERDRMTGINAFIPVELPVFEKRQDGPDRLRDRILADEVFSIWIEQPM